MKKRRKLPWMPFFPLDWLGDTRSLSTRQKGIWIDLICYMWGAKNRGKLTSDWESIARMVGEPWLECESEIRQISRKNVLEIQEDGVTVTLLCRRMVFDENKRESIRLRVSGYRKEVSNALVTRMKQGEVRSQKLEVIKDKDLKTPLTPQGGAVGDFEDFWKAYPRKVAKPVALKAWLRLSPKDELLRQMGKALGFQKKSFDWIKEGGKFVPHPATWINQRRWEDELNGDSNARPRDGLDKLMAREDEETVGRKGMGGLPDL